MLTSDLIAIGIIVLCIVLALCGVLKWLLRFCAGVALGLLILSCVALLADNPEFNEITKGKLNGGKVIPCVRRTEHVKRLRRRLPLFQKGREYHVEAF
ncbi:MAG: hypothetical protein ACYTFQ_10430 [Planctomycetota bacterium]|jgi:hypothetical protein